MIDNRTMWRRRDGRSLGVCVTRRRAAHRSALLGWIGLLIASSSLNAVASAQAAPSGQPASAAGDPPIDLYGDPAHPNVSGLWRSDRVGLFVDYATTPLPLTEAYKAKLKIARALIDKGTPRMDSVSRCIAFGVPRFMLLDFELIQTPRQVTMISYIFHDVRRVYMSPLEHTPNVDPSYNGDSVGRWEGDTLVIETTNLRAGNLDQFGVDHSDKLKVVERIRRTAPDKIEIEFTLTDPEAFTRPWVVTRTYTRRDRGDRFEEYVCENNRNDGGDLQR